MKEKKKPRGKPFAKGNAANPHGRPKANDPKKNRICIRATDGEWAALTKIADETGASLMGYIRSVLFDNLDGRQD